MEILIVFLEKIQANLTQRRRLVWTLRQQTHRTLVAIQKGSSSSCHLAIENDDDDDDDNALSIL